MGNAGCCGLGGPDSRASGRGSSSSSIDRTRNDEKQKKSEKEKSIKNVRDDSIRKKKTPVLNKKTSIHGNIGLPPGLSSSKTLVEDVGLADSEETVPKRVKPPGRTSSLSLSLFLFFIL